MTIASRRKGRIAIYTIANPSAMNALGKNSLKELKEHLTEFNNDPDLWAGIITGEGEKAFCSGFDIREFSTGTFYSAKVRHRQSLARNGDKKAFDCSGKRRGFGRRPRVDVSVRFASSF